MKKYSKGEISVIILKTLLAVGAVAVVIALPGVAQVFTIFKPKDSRDRYKIKRSINTLENKKLVRRYSKNGIEMIELTRLGRSRAIMGELKLVNQKKWDKKWRLVIFDIPENKKIARRSLSRKLKEIGFYQLQKSVFVYPYQCKKEIDFIREYFDVKKYVKYIEAQNVEGGDKLNRCFDIS